jgi:hypothetical protein
MNTDFKPGKSCTLVNVAKPMETLNGYIFKVTEDTITAHIYDELSKAPYVYETDILGRYYVNTNLKSYLVMDEVKNNHYSISQRDYFIGCAITGLVSRVGYYSDEYMAGLAINLANTICEKIKG